MTACDPTIFAWLLFIAALFGSAIGSGAVLLHQWINKPRG